MGASTGKVQIPWLATQRAGGKVYPGLIKPRSTPCQRRCRLHGAGENRGDPDVIFARADRLEAAILTRALRGEPVPQDPDDEPASLLLARIRTQRSAAPKPKRSRKTKETADA
jgi:hypothetical protein